MEATPKVMNYDHTQIIHVVERLERTQGRSEPYAGYESKPENAASIKSLTELQTSAVS